MATGASTADLAIILIDARHGVQVQTKRHSCIVSLLGIRHVIVAINKMDLVEFSEARYNEIVQEYQKATASLELPEPIFVPLSALNGDNVVEKSGKTPWYAGEPLMAILESVPVSGDRNLTDFRFPVQYVIRPDLNFRGFAGTIASGVIRKGDVIVSLPSGKQSKVKSIVTYDGELEEAFAPMAVTITLEDEIDVSRGNLLAKPDNLPVAANGVEATLVWMHETPMVPGKSYLLKHGTHTVPATVEAVEYRIDVNTFEKLPTEVLDLNGIGRVRIHTEAPLLFDAYRKNRESGNFILIDRLTNATVGAGMLEKAVEVAGKGGGFSAFELELNALIRKHFPHWEAKDLSALLKG